MTNEALSISKSEALVLWVTYFLYLLFAPALIGFGINYWASKAQNKRPGKLPAWSENKDVILSHHMWLMRTFIFVSAGVMAGLGTMYSGFGYIVAAAAIIWWFYRVIKGMVAFAHYKKMPA